MSRRIYANNVIIIGIVIFCLGASSVDVHAACVDVRQTGKLTFEGTLTYQMFAGPPNFEDVRRGDAPEPSYVLELDDPIYATGDDSLDGNEKIDRIQVFPEFDSPADGELSKDLRRLVGKRVLVEGKSAFGRSTVHHHAPLLLPISRVTAGWNPTEAYGTVMTTVEGFYLALGAGNGDEGAKFVIPRKRAVGPPSAIAITSFYGDLVEPLRLLSLSRSSFLIFSMSVSIRRRRKSACSRLAVRSGSASISGMASPRIRDG